MATEAQSCQALTVDPGRYSAITVFPASLDSLSKAVAHKWSLLYKLCRPSAVEKTLETAMHQYESLMVLNLAPCYELEDKMKDPSGEQYSEWKAAADKRPEMMLRADTVFDWHKTRSASCVFTLQDVQLLKDTLTETNNFLARYEDVGLTSTKEFWDKAVEEHGNAREAHGFPRLASEPLLGDARAAVTQLLQWSDELHTANVSVTTSADFKNYIEKKQVEFNELSERISWSKDRSETSMPWYKISYRDIKGSFSPDKAIRRVRSSLGLGGAPSTSGPQNGDETTFDPSTANRSDVPQINVTRVEV